MDLSRWLVPSTALLCVFACNGLVDAGAVEPSGDDGDAAASAIDASSVSADAASQIPWELDVSDYDQSCQYNANCQPVQHGPCSECMCYDAAVNQADVTRYRDDLAEERQRTQCPEYGEYLGSCNDLCDNTRIGLCENGRCVVGENRWLDASVYDHACITVEDCVAVSEALCYGGAPCTAAIAKSAMAQFDAARAAAPACGTPPPLEPTDCNRDALRCEDGQCVLYFPEVP